MNKHKHAEIIIAWANGAKIEFRTKTNPNWTHTNQPMWDDNAEYRIRPEPEMIHFQRFTLFCDANEHRFDKLKGVVTVHPQFMAIGDVLVKYINNIPVEIHAPDISGLEDFA